jgi:hypothetical protein
MDNGQSNNGVENGNDADQRTVIGLSSPIPFPARDQNNHHAETQSYYQYVIHLFKIYAKCFFML